MRKSLGNKNCQFSPEHIKNITDTYLDFIENEDAKIFDNADFGFNKIIVDRPLRLSAKITDEAIESLRFIDKLRDLMSYFYAKHPQAVYEDLESLKNPFEAYVKLEEIKVSPADKKKFFNVETWKHQLEVMAIAKKLQAKVDKEFNDFNAFKKAIDKALKDLGLKFDNADKKVFLSAVSWKDEQAKEVIKKKTAKGVEFEADSDLRDSESVPLKEDIQVYFDREVLPFVADAWIDHSKTVKGYEINFNRHFYKPKQLRTLDTIRADILALEDETDGVLNSIIH